MRQKIIKTGNSLGVTIPSKVVKSLGLKPGDEVEVKFSSEKAELRATFSGPHQLSLTSEK